MNHASVNIADRHDSMVPQDLLNESVLWFGEAINAGAVTFGNGTQG